jgi:hypothetical protein
MTFTEATGNDLFVSFTIASKITQFVTQDNKVYSIILAGQKSREDYESLLEIAVPLNRFLDGAIIESEANDRLARIRGAVFLATLTTTLYNSGQSQNAEAVSKSGLVTKLTHATDSGFNNQQVQFEFHTCKKVHYQEAGALETIEVF